MPTSKTNVVFPCGIGGGSWGYYTGSIDDVRIYNRALSAAEVKALYEGGGAGGTTCTVTYDAAGGTTTRLADEVAAGAAVGTLPTASRAGYEFLGWFTAAAGGTKVTAATVVTGDVTWHAQWRKIRYSITHGKTIEADDPMDAGIANTYDGVVLDADGLPLGYVNIKAGKASKRGVSKVTVMIQMAGEAKKVTIKDNVPVAEAALVKSAPDGRVLDIAFTRNSIFGTFDGYEIEGARNLLASKAKDDAKAAAEAALNRLIGNYVLAYGDELGYSGLTVSIMKKGKVKVSGKLANGMSVSTASQLITGEDYCCIPVVYTKKGTSLAFSIYFPNEGGDPVVFGYYDAMVSPVAGLGSGVSFFVGEALYDLFADYSLLDEFLPCGVSVAQNVSSPDTASVQDSEAERLRAKLRSLASMGDEKPERI